MVQKVERSISWAIAGFSCGGAMVVVQEPAESRSSLDSTLEFSEFGVLVQRSLTELFATTSRTFLREYSPLRVYGLSCGRVGEGRVRLSNAGTPASESADAVDHILG